jgi:hypothetical protein
MKKINLIASFFLIVLITFFSSCKKDPEVSPNNTNNGSGDPGHTVTGVVRDQNGNNLSGITVQCDGQTATTGNFGEFTFKNVTVSDNRIVVYSNPSNYFAATATEIPSSTKRTMMNLTLMTKTTTQVLSSSTGGSATHTSGSSVTIPADAVQKNGTSYSGNVNVAVAYLDPTQSSFGSLTQGPDMKAVNSSGKEGTLSSYGIIRVELTDDSGKELNLSSGKSATIKVPVPSSLQGTAPATIPLWYFDETKGVWVEEGSAVKTGNEYVGTVSHFTDWNCDVYTSSQATITGRIVDCNNEPVSYIGIRLGQTYAWADQNGVFSRRVPSGLTLDCQVEATGNIYGLTSDPFSIPSLTDGQQYNVGDVKLTTCPTYVKGKVVDCNNNPTDAWIKLKSATNGYLQFLPVSLDGTFKAQVGTNENLQLSIATGNGGFVIKSLTTSSDPSFDNDFGTVSVCGDVTIGENSFVIDGDGFTNEKVMPIITTPLYNYNSPNDDYAYSRTGGDSLLINVNGPVSLSNTNYQNAFFDIFFGYNATPAVGTYNFGTNVSGFINITGPNTTSNYYSSSGTVTITKFEPQGGLVEGTFSGTFALANGNGEVTITNGKFSTLAFPNSYFYKKVNKK